MYGYHRRKDISGTPMLVNLPTKGYENTGEGGMAFYLVVLSKHGKGQRCVCCAESLFWQQSEVCLSPKKFNTLPQQSLIDAGLLIGSTGLSLFHNKSGEYFKARYSDLTEEGKALYRLIKKLYGTVSIVTLLDT